MRTINRTEQNNLDTLRGFKGVWIPRNVWLSKLTWAEKGLICEINSLTKDGVGCFAGNERFAAFLGVTERQVSNLISRMKKIGIIQQQSFDGRKRYLTANLSLVEEQGSNGLLCTGVQGRVEADFRADLKNKGEIPENTPRNPLLDKGLHPPLIEKNRKQYRDNPLLAKIQTFVRQFYASRMRQYPTRVRTVTESQINQAIDTIDKLVRIDKFTLPDVIQTIVWAVDDEFWSTNVFSLVGLRTRSKNGRTKFENIQAGMSRDKNAPPIQSSPPPQLDPDNSDYGNMMGIKDKDFVR